MNTYPAITAALTGPIPDLLVAVWSELGGEHSDTGRYTAATTFERLIGFQGNPLAVAVANTAPHARILEDGHAAFHLPEKIDWGTAKAKRTKDGVRYLTIPFRHGTPGTQGVGSGRARSMMPGDVYRSALTLFRRPQATDAQRTAARDRLDAAGTQLSRPYGLKEFPRALRDRAIRQEGQPGYTWRSRTFEGLTYREQTSPSGRSSGSYFTFRVLREDSVGWFIPAFAGYGIAAQVVQRTRQHLTEIVGEAARADVVELVELAVGRAA